MYGRVSVGRGTPAARAALKVVMTDNRGTVSGVVGWLRCDARLLPPVFNCVRSHRAVRSSSMRPRRRKDPNYGEGPNLREGETPVSAKELFWGEAPSRVRKLGWGARHVGWDWSCWRDARKAGAAAGHAHAFSTEDLIPTDHPIRRIRTVVEAVLAELEGSSKRCTHESAVRACRPSSC